jgi:5-methyltetrahydrofolate--homocysteine methyltransferase
VALTERADESFLMRRTIKTLAPGARAAGLRHHRARCDGAALRVAPGRCCSIPSTWKPGGQSLTGCSAGQKVQRSGDCPDDRRAGHGQDRERKVEVARRIYEMAVDEHGLRPQDLVFDDLTFTLATGDPEFNESAIETIEGIRQIKQELPGVLTSLGVSNVSFGLSRQRGRC